MAETFLKEAAPGEYSTEYVQFVRKYLDLISFNDSVFMTMHFRKFVNDNADEIPWEGMAFSVAFIRPKPELRMERSLAVLFKKRRIKRF